MLDNTTILQYCFSKYILPYFTTSIRKHWKKIKIQIALDFNFCHHVEPEFTATTRNFASSISGAKTYCGLYLPAPGLRCC